jgi:hypothetical protein
MIKLDFQYSDFVIWGAPGYPGGKAYDASNPDSINGTPYKADWMNDVNGFFQALIVSAFGNMSGISGVPDTSENSDRLKALYKVIENIFGRVPTATEGPFVVDIDQAKRYQIFFIGSSPEAARVFLPDITNMAAVDVVEIEIFNVSTLNLQIIIYPESELLTLPPGGWIKIRPFNITASSSKWGHSFHYVDNIVPLAPVRYDHGGRLKSARPVLDEDVLRYGDRDIYVQTIDFTPVYQLINSNTARIEALEQAVAQDIYQNPFIITFADLMGVDVISGSWNTPLGRLECSYVGGGINILLTNLDSIKVISGVWNTAQARLEC